MGQSPEHPGSEFGSEADSRADQPPGLPRWVKVSGLVLAVLLALLLAAHLLSGGGHGPGSHMSIGADTVPSARASEAAPPNPVTTQEGALG